MTRRIETAVYICFSISKQRRPAQKNDNNAKPKNTNNNNDKKKLTFPSSDFFSMFANVFLFFCCTLDFVYSTRTVDLGAHTKSVHTIIIQIAGDFSSLSLSFSHSHTLSLSCEYTYCQCYQCVSIIYNPIKYQRAICVDTLRKEWKKIKK